MAENCLPDQGELVSLKLGIAVPKGYPNSDAYMYLSGSFICFGYAFGHHVLLYSSPKALELASLASYRMHVVPTPLWRKIVAIDKLETHISEWL